jgi:hypothetical protein
MRYPLTIGGRHQRVKYAKLRLHLLAVVVTATKAGTPISERSCNSALSLRKIKLYVINAWYAVDTKISQYDYY